MPKKTSLIMIEDWFGDQSPQRAEEDVFHGAENNFDMLENDIATLSDYEYVDCSAVLENLKRKQKKQKTHYSPLVVDFTPKVSIMEELSSHKNLDVEEEKDNIQEETKEGEMVDVQPGGSGSGSQKRKRKQKQKFYTVSPTAVVLNYETGESDSDESNTIDVVKEHTSGSDSSDSIMVISNPESDIEN